MSRIALNTILTEVLDLGTWRPLSLTEDQPKFGAQYLADLKAAAKKSESEESIVFGEAQIGGHPVMVVASDFDFLAGSIGSVAAKRICAAFDQATQSGLPVVGLPTSGGTRMQEGTPTFLLMASIAAAVTRHRAAGLPYLVYLRNPTTGGVFATWGSLGDVTFGEPQALTGFLGPRVYEGLYGKPFPPEVQTSEGLAGAGVIDEAADPASFRMAASELLTTWAAGGSGGGMSDKSTQAESGETAGHTEVRSADPGRSDPDAWASILATRQSDRLGSRALLASADGVVLLSGDQAGDTAGGTLLGLARFCGLGVVFVAQDRRAQLAGGLVGPGDLRVARRGMRLAETWGLPLLTIVDTQGGELSVEAESGALAGEIARCLADLSALTVPTVSLLLGGGGGGAALALLPADRVIAAADSWVTPLPAEGASLIRHRTTERADEMARSQRITAVDLQRAGAVDRIVPALTSNVGSALGPISEMSGSIRKSDEPDLELLVSVLAVEVRAAAGVSDRVGARAARWAKIQ